MFIMKTHNILIGKQNSNNRKKNQIIYITKSLSYYFANPVIIIKYTKLNYIYNFIQ